MTPKILVALVLALVACGNGKVIGTVMCMPQAAAETQCSDGIDDDCDGYTDCLDTECEGQACAGGTCAGGACVKPCPPGMVCGPPALPTISNIRVTMRGDTALVDFEPVDNALDYRIYLEPDPADWLLGTNGEVGVKNAVYRCAGDRPISRRDDDPAGYVAESLAGKVRDYLRTEAESVLGYVYLTPAADRQAVYQVSNPNLNGGFSWGYEAPASIEDNGAEYVVGTAARDRLLAMGWRDDGIAFYAPTAGTVPIYRRLYKPAMDGTQVVLFYTDGPEKVTRDAESTDSFVDSGERLRVLAAPTNGAVALHRVYYLYNNSHDVLAAGEARFQRALHQGNRPLPSLMWPGLTGKTQLIIEALDKGCPFPGGYIGAAHAPTATVNAQASITLDEARLATGEVFVNGQHEPTNRPVPIARGRVDVTPEPHPKMDWFQSFDVGAPWGPFETIVEDGNGNDVYHSSEFSIEFDGASPNHAIGPVLGRLHLGSDSPVHLVARGVDARMSDSSYLHVTMSTDMPATARRYPQIWITTAPVVSLADVPASVNVPIATRLGPWPFQMLPPGTEHTIVVQPFSRSNELQIEFCDLRGWGVSQQCDRANIYGYHAGSETESFTAPWTAVPVMGEYAGMDRLVKFDVYASTERVYVFVEDRPAGCAVLPAGRMPAKPVSVVFGSAAYHIDVDADVVTPTAANQYWQRYSVYHVDRHMDDLGVALSVPKPAWDESVLPCGTEWYGGSK